MHPFHKAAESAILKDGLHEMASYKAGEAYKEASRLMEALGYRQDKTRGIPRVFVNPDLGVGGCYLQGSHTVVIGTTVESYQVLVHEMTHAQQGLSPDSLNDMSIIRRMDGVYGMDTVGYLSQEMEYQAFMTQFCVEASRVTTKHSYQRWLAEAVPAMAAAMPAFLPLPPELQEILATMM